jgi:periplasmic protein TonB
MSQSLALYRIYDLPWSTGAEQEARFRRLVRSCIAVVLVLALILSWLPLPQRSPDEVHEIPKRLARLVIERQQPPPPPPPPVVKEVPPEPEPVVQERAEPKVEPKEAPKPEPKPPVDTTEQARARAKVAGLLPFAKQLSALRDNDTVQRLDKAAVINSPAPGASPVTERSLITSRVGKASGGINTAALSRNIGGGGLGSREITQVENPVEDIGPVGGAAQRTGGTSAKASRSREEIERVFDRNKGAIYALYNRALRTNPALQGKLVLRLTIAPDGTVTFCEVVSSELGDPELEQKLVQRVLLFQFEPKDVEPVTTTKPIDFFPA